ncbi:hypothetical protein AAG747_04715 [Rapidithrix thailandica]|uniref:Uncharacterized protein n=1 Tax=Rapidithrix thailandica TaxID=413964 RepID=A0AAW9RQM9_9BACT
MKVITFTKPVKNESNGLPKSYLEFIGEYGYGTYCGLINITQPDEQVIHRTFSEFDFWEFDKNFTKQDLRRAIQLASTTDGDMICYVENKPDHLFILPRNSETILGFENLKDVFLFYQENYQLSGLYFEPSWGRKTELFSLIHDEKLLDIKVLHKQFLKDFEYDSVIGKEQPKYVIEKIGGWVKFDLLYKNSITISYQFIEHSDNAYSTYLDYLKKEIKQLKTL